MKTKDKTIKISEKAYNFLKNCKKKTGIPVKVIIDQIISGDFVITAKL